MLYLPTSHAPSAINPITGLLWTSCSKLAEAYIARCYYGSDIQLEQSLLACHESFTNFEQGIDREFLDPEYHEYIRCLDGIPGISVLLDDDNKDPATICPAAPEPVISLNHKPDSEPSVVSETLQHKTNTRFAIPVTSPERKKVAKRCDSYPIQRPALDGLTLGLSITMGLFFWFCSAVSCILSLISVISTGIYIGETWRT